MAKEVFVGCDSSLTSTAVSFYDSHKGKWYHINYSKDLDMAKPPKWYKIASRQVDLFSYSREQTGSDQYAMSEAVKLEAADRVSDWVYLELKKFTSQGYSAYGCIEGYSYGSDAGHLIDLVCMGTLLRKKIGDLCSAPMYVIAPSHLKRFAAESTYPPPDKKGPYRNYDGIPGGSFKKHQMMQAMLDNPELSETGFGTLCESLWGEIRSQATVKSPFDDVVDSIWAAWAARHYLKLAK